ncbi:STAS domain-containing protein [Roseateles saccharophilus]|uniref:Phospholipid transport system transporter-binding protein n=1 Tax=Roseateles saccharophilus TaxID=304 RepID=A0A4R3ULK4_ROSSA|nr:STAS domain-containing protein [Roseateles saccharophilus]MDG0834106.1 STAS domain-containing protein [Roseateles saccharophilus]TCU90834.1 phospholipid transport system transporter-binding protein [Roseateles saccharophilus]
MLSGLKLPARLRMDGARAAWAQLSPALRAEAAQVLAAAGREVRLSAAELADFDSSALSLLLSAARQCSEQGATLKLEGVPDKLRELARVYGVAELFWPPAAA